MRKRGPGSYHKPEDVPSISSREVRNLESGFTRNDYKQINTDLSEIHNRLKVILEKLVYSDVSEFFRLAKIVDHSLEELKFRVNSKATTEFPVIRDVEKTTVEVNEYDDSEISWEALCHLEPGLLDLWSEAEEVVDHHRTKSFCKYDYFSKHLVDRLSEMLGPWTDNQSPKLSSIKSIDLAKDTIMGALPACRNCKKHNS